ncbi:hypothetical protein ACFY5J_00535 [Peribacillus butanolivorans]|uniref:hypothetical protein n=1 Tax=Peribacillus butanolivorans TaxID=421767 RepID=UPI0036B00436
MREITYLIGIFIVGCFFIYYYSEPANTLQVSADEWKKEYDDLNNEIFKDLNKSFPNLDLKEYNQIYDMDELSNMLETNEKNEDIESLMKLFTGTTMGKKLLFIKENQGYILYKKENGYNVLQEIKKKNNTWVISDERVTKGKKISIY